MPDRLNGAEHLILPEAVADPTAPSDDRDTRHNQCEDHMKITVKASTCKAHSGVAATIEVDDEDLEGLDQPQRDRLLDQRAFEALKSEGLIDWGWENAS